MHECSLCVVLEWRYITNIPTNYASNTVYKSIFTNMAMVRVFEVRSDQLQVYRICTQIISSSHKDKDDDDDDDDDLQLQATETCSFEYHTILRPSAQESTFVGE
jgi:hypothetical protein